MLKPGFKIPKPSEVGSGFAILKLGFVFRGLFLWSLAKPTKKKEKNIENGNVRLLVF